MEFAIKYGIWELLWHEKIPETHVLATQLAGNAWMLNERVGKKSLRNWLNYVPDLIQDIYLEKGQHEKTPSKTPPATARWTAVSHTGGHQLV